MFIKLTIVTCVACANVIRYQPADMSSIETKFIGYEQIENLKPNGLLPCLMELASLSYSETLIVLESKTSCLHIAFKGSYIPFPDLTGLLGKCICICR